MSDGVAPALASTHGYALAWRIGAVLCLVGGGLVLFLLEHVIATPRNVEAEALASEAEPVPAA